MQSIGKEEYYVVKQQPKIDTIPTKIIAGHLPSLSANPAHNAPKVRPPIVNEVISVLISPSWFGIHF